jgi:hypothetical protein
MTLTKLPGSKWWIETDDVTFEIIGTYNKTFIIADIQAIRDTLLRYPSATQDSSDVADLLTAIVGKWTPAKNARIVALINSMYQAYQGNPLCLEAAQLQAKLDALIILRDRLV